MILRLSDFVRILVILDSNDLLVYWHEHAADQQKSNQPLVLHRRILVKTDLMIAGASPACSR